MHHRTWLSCIVLVGAITGCDKPEAPAPQRSSAQHKVAAPPPPSISSEALQRQLPGDWVLLMTPPRASKSEDICATDAALSLLPGGEYWGMYERGNWRVSNGRLIVTTTHSSEDTGGEGPEQRLKPPQILQFTLLKVEANLLTVKMTAGPAWLYRCPMS